MLNKPLHDVKLVINRKLNRHARLYFENRLWLGNFVFMFEVQINEMIAMDSVNREDSQDGEVRNENKDVEGCKPVQTIPMVDGGELIKVCPLWRDDQAQHKN